MTPDPFDRELADTLGLPGDPGQAEAEADALWEDMPSAAVRPVAAGWLRFAVAAVAVLAIGVAGFFAWKSGNSRETGSMDTTAVVSAEGEFFVIDVAPDRSTLLVQTYDDFAVDRIGRNDRVGAYELKEIREEGIVVQKSGAAPVIHSVDDWNREAAKRLSVEVSGLQALHRSGRLTDKQVLRARSIADSGNADAVRLLGDLAASFTPGSGAEEIVREAGQEADISDRLAELAANGTSETSRYSLHTLGQLGTPAALNRLRMLSLSLSADRAVFAVRELARQEPRRVASLLVEVRDAASESEVRDAARVAIESMSVQDTLQSK